MPIDLLSQGSRRGQQHIRRARILAATRHLMATRGHRQFNISEVAENSSISIQTIYYNFGNKKELILSALHEYNEYIHMICLKYNQTPTVFMDISLTYFKCTLYFSEFMREWLRCSYDGTPPILLYLQEEGQKFKTRIISKIAQNFNLHDGCSSNSISYLLSKTNTSSLYDWSIDNNFIKLEEKLISSTAEVIANSFVDGASQIEIWKSRYMKMYKV